jgi:hypothetical protein
VRKRWIWFSLCVLAAALTFLCGWLIPAHLRALEAGVVARAGKGSATLVSRGLELLNQHKPGAALLLIRAAQAEGVPGWESLGAAITNASKQDGGARSGQPLDPGSDPYTEFVVRLENRDRMLELLQASRKPAVQELLRTRNLTNTVLFPPSQSPSGQAFDAALSICGLLVDGQHLQPALADSIVRLAAAGNHGGSPQPFEEILLDFMSLGQRLNWNQLTEFVSKIQAIDTLRRLADTMRNSEDQVPVLFSAVELSGEPDKVASYVANFSETGLQDLGASLRSGSAGVNELLRRNQRLYDSNTRRHVAMYNPFGAFYDWAADYCWRAPGFALIIKWLLLLGAGYFIATALHFARPAVPVLEQPLQVRGFHVAREVLFALGFLLVVLLLSEPFLSQGSQKVEMPFRVRLPMVGNAVPAGTTGARTSLMNKPDNYALLTLLLFFVLQALLYTACLFKLAEIRRQRVGPRIKLRLLDNEEHLFDAGLYLGFAGTIISLILVSLNFIKPSLMAAYSSTSFGIIFVSIFKIFHLRPLKRQLVLESEALPSDQTATAAAASRPMAAPL